MADMPDGFGPDDPPAPDQAETTKMVKVGFKLTENAPSNPPTPEPWIMIELAEPGTVALGLPDGMLGLQFDPKASMEEASRLRQDLDRLVSHISFTPWLT